MATISTHNGSSVSKRHNERDASVCSKEKHIDLSKPHENWINEDHREAYSRIFGDALDEYNARQKRADRKINDYYDKVSSDKKKHLVYEMIIGVYDPTVPVEVKKAILREFVDNWKERNPNLELVGAYYHADEQGRDPHVHIDYVPVARGCKRGLAVQNALNKALEQQGFKSKDIHHTAQIMWQRRENDYLETLCRDVGIEVEHDLIKREHLDTDLYKKSMARSIKAEKKLESSIDQLKDDLMPVELTEPAPVKIKKSFFTGKKSVSFDDYEQLKDKHVETNKAFGVVVENTAQVVSARKHENADLEELIKTFNKRNSARATNLVREENKGLLNKINMISGLLDAARSAREAIAHKFDRLKKQYDKVVAERDRLASENKRLQKALVEQKNERSVPLSRYMELAAENELNERRTQNLADFLLDRSDLRPEQVENIANGRYFERTRDSNELER